MFIYAYFNLVSPTFNLIIFVKQNIALVITFCISSSIFIYLFSGKRQLDACTQESNSLELRINAVETKITEAISTNQSAEAGILLFFQLAIIFN